MGLRTRLVRLMGGLGRWGAGFECEPPRRIVAVWDEFRYERGPSIGFRDRHGLRQGRGESHGGFAISSNPAQRTRITHVVIGLESRTLSFVTAPMRVGEPVRMLVRWIAIVDMKKRSLS